MLGSFDGGGIGPGAADGVRGVAKRHLRLLFALVSVVALGAVVVGVAYYRPISVAVLRAEQDVPITVFGLGTVEARVLSRIGFEVGAALTGLYADHGDRVAHGTVLARLHSAEQEARLAMAQAKLIQAEASLKVAEAEIGKARAVLAQKKQANRRKQALLARKTASAEVAEEAQMEEDVAGADLSVALSGVEVARAAVADAQAEVVFEQTLLDHYALGAPFDAVVVARHNELGAVLTAGEPLFTLVAADTVWVLGYVEESRAGAIRVGQPAEVRLRSLPGSAFAGQVARIGLESDRVSEERRVYVTCDQCFETFYLGEQAEILITTAVLDEALLVAETAVQGFDGAGGTVWTIEDGRLARRPVKFGHRTVDARLEIVDGLPAGARVVADELPGMREGRAATVIEIGSP